MDISFCIITNGEDNKLLLKVIQSIKYQKIPNYEIIVVGNFYSIDGITYIPDIDAAQNGTLGKLRNTALKNTKYDIICMLDDDIILSPDWYKAVKNKGNDFDICTSQIRLPDGSMYFDHVTYGGSRGHILLDENEDDEFLYMTGGGGWLMKRYVFDNLKYNETLKFNECEDSNFSIDCRDAGYKISHNHKAVVFHSAPIYTSIGRLCLKRKLFKDHLWVSHNYRGKSLEYLKSEANEALNKNYIGEWADIIRYALELNPDCIELQNILNDYKNKHTGYLKNEEWFSQGYPKYNQAIELYTNEIRKINLKNVTLIIVDCVETKRAEFAINQCLKYCNFADVKLLSSIKCDNSYWVKIPHINSLEEYSNFIVKKLNKYVDTDYALVIQWDGFVVNPDMWTDKYFDYDYIGAIWNQTPFMVGNGGFSLRSKKLLEELAKIPDNVQCHPDDRFVSYFVKQKFKIAEPAIANLFSTEYLYGGSFGFHNIYLTDFSIYHKEFPKVKNTAVHSGDVGDIIYCVPTLRALNVEKIILNSRADWGTHSGKNYMEALKPLLEEQGFEVVVQEGYDPLEVNYIMDYWRRQSDLTRLQLMVSQANYFNVNINTLKPFLTVTPKHIADIIINQTSRYPAEFLDWEFLLDGFDNVVFLGHITEYENFVKKYPKLINQVKYIKTNTLLEAAEFIAASKMYIGNQSCLLAIAEGLKANRIAGVDKRVPETARPSGTNGMQLDSRADLIKARELMVCMFDKIKELQ